MSKQLFGAKYERVVKGLIACMILFLAVSAAEMEMADSSGGRACVLCDFTAGDSGQSVDYLCHNLCLRHLSAKEPCITA